MSVVGLAVIPGSASAAGGTYDVVKCFTNLSRFDTDPEITEGGGGARYLIRQECGPANPLHRLSIENTGTEVYGHQGTFTISAPPGTLIDAAWFQSHLAQANGHVAQVLAINPYEQRVLRQSTPGGDFGYASAYATGLAHTQFQIRVICLASTCPSSGLAAHAYVRNIHLVLRDNADPTIASVGGDLLSGAWVRGRPGLSVSSSDVGSGIVGLAAFVNGTSLYNATASADVLCGGETPPYTVHLVPCHGTPNVAVHPNTASGPFRNGENEVLVRAVDYAGNVTLRGYLARVDNQRPRIAFANAQDPNDPELVRARVSDRHSGVADAQIFLRAVGSDKWNLLESEIEGGMALGRVDSLRLPAGEYEFMATATDLAGNESLATTREDGTPMTLAFPLKDSVDLRAHLNRGGSKGQIVRYGTDAKAKGMLLDASGNPLADQQVTIVEHFGAGALVRERVSNATTDEKGKWRSKVPAGPSRDLEAIYGGSPRYAPAQRGAGTFVVRSRASFKTSRKNVPEGKAVTFKGKVRHFGARIPSGGKLVELQVRMKTGRWDTIGEAFRTSEKGVYKRRYRFGKHYVSDAVFRFRVKVKRESKWPYKRTTTHHRTVIVRAD